MVTEDTIISTFLYMILFFPHAHNNSWILTRIVHIQLIFLPFNTTLLRVKKQRRDEEKAGQASTVLEGAAREK